ncbi:MAG: MbnP family copper-binding protein [Bacteroidota bacterium]
MFFRYRPSIIFATAAAAVLCASCDSASQPEVPAPFALRFAALAGQRAVGCGDDLAGFGPAGANNLGVNDLRFYVSDLKFKNKEGKAVDVALDQNEFQFSSNAGSVALIDLTGNTEGSCDTSSLAYAEGTARTNLVITGTTQIHEVTSISFSVGVPQPLMKATIATSTPEGAPSPLNEMYWNWNTGYRHFVLNFTVTDGAGARGDGYVHLGSRDCAPSDDGIKALQDRDTCTFVNTPAVTMTGFDLTTNTIGVDLGRIVDGLDFVSPTYAPTTFEVIGQGPGIECHSSPMQPDCGTIFGHFGLDIGTGKAAAASDAVFVKVR